MGAREKLKRTLNLRNMEMTVASDTEFPLRCLFKRFMVIPLLLLSLSLSCTYVLCMACVSRVLIDITPGRMCLCACVRVCLQFIYLILM